MSNNATRAKAPIPAGAHRKPAESPRKRHAGRIALITLFCLLAIIYLSGVALFSFTCYPNTSIADVDVSLMGKNAVISHVSAAAQNYRLTITGEGFSWSFEPEHAEDIVDPEAAIKTILASNEPLAWPVRLYEALTLQDKSRVQQPADSHDVELPDTFDVKSFTADIQNAVEAYNADKTGTFDAAGAYDPESEQFTVERARANQQLDGQVVERLALQAVSQLKGRVELDATAQKPLAGGATDEQLQQACDEANKLIGTNINLTMGGATVATLDGKQLAQWITFDDELSPALSTEPVTAWVRELAQKIDTVGSERSYTRPDGKQIKVVGGSYGWMSDEKQLVKMMKDAVANKQVGDIEVPLKQKAATFSEHGKPDWKAYVDIDLTEQHARYYDETGTMVWESGVITGNPNKGNATPAGVYSLRTNNGASKLIGKKDPETGKPEYETPVSYWMPFVGNAIGLHDASWQSAASFSDPSAYTRVGSHGCVNLPTDKAQQLHDIIHVGDCVIVHQ